MAAMAAMAHLFFFFSCHQACVADPYVQYETDNQDIHMIGVEDLSRSCGVPWGWRGVREFAPRSLLPYLSSKNSLSRKDTEFCNSNYNPPPTAYVIAKTWPTSHMITRTAGSLFKQKGGDLANQQGNPA
ncbi:hypothetical protein F5X97DRAFT_9897 [Nemania serpens]|nr:hypothetical protein F5X97DRAFT_9897 [Nemania serpens]